MKIAKMKSKALVLDDDLAYTQQLGLPVEIFSPKRHQTIAFGKIQIYTDKYVCINGQLFCREDHVLFGCPYPSENTMKH